MKKLILLAGAATLAACSANDSADAGEEAVEDTAMDDTAMEEAALAPDGGPVAGTYEVTPEEGDAWTTVIAADGSYTSTYADGTVETGTMAMQDEMTACFDNAADEEGPVCSASTIGEDGTWTATGERGTVTVVRKDG
ncbi:hypothetical protein [Sphingomicrobium marinum]|uniref:hypothetical protein n=1 Tax=Sphingomicrobium marinum TaxID=1227950 RepID=UPI00223ED85F|nr:hypothetical protein [Sphingomicrobium marinum]